MRNHDDEQKPEWFDSHCHFDFPEFDGDRRQLWQDIQASGVTGLLVPGISHQQGVNLPSFCAGKPWYYALGLHPYFMAQHQGDDLQWLDRALAEDAPIAVGEVGLDRVLATDEQLLEQQWYWFRAQVELAQQHRLPLILHIRGMHDEAASFLKRCGFNQGGIVHAFSGSRQQAHRWLDLGFALGVGGAMTHPRAQKLRRTLQTLPPEAMLLETDSPDMLPAFWRGPRNDSRSLPVIAAMLALLTRASLPELARIQRQNLMRIFPRFS